MLGSKGGQITAIDRSATAVARTTARNAEHLAAGRAVLEQVELADFGGRRGEFDKALSVNVNVFWTTSAEAECAVLSRVLEPGGRLWLVYGGPAPGTTRDLGPTVAANLKRRGFVTEVVSHPGGMVAGRLALTDQL